MLQVKSGDIDKLGILFERYKNSLFHYFFRISWNRDVSEDLVQNVFFRMLKYRHNFTGEGKFTSWMYHIAHNVFVDNFRKNKKYHYEEELTHTRSTEDDNLEKQIVKEEELKLLNDSLKLLNPEKRELLVLSKLRGMRYKDIGEVLNISEGAVKARICRAVKELKDIYLQLGGENENS